MTVTHIGGNGAASEGAEALDEAIVFIHYLLQRQTRLWGYARRQVRQRPVLQGLDRPGPAMGDPGDFLQRQIGHKPQHDDLSLVGSQAVESFHQLGVEGIGICGAGPIGHSLRTDGRPPSSPSGVIDNPVTGHFEHPPPHGLLVTPDPVQISGHLKEDLTQYILGLRNPLRPQIAQHGGGQMAVDHRRITTLVPPSHSYMKADRLRGDQ
jgi:hypothetical protein